jgi:hypothetical protein
VYYPLPVFATESPSSQQEQAALQAFWQDPADPANHELLLEHGIDYVVVPQAIVDAETDTPWDWGDLPEIAPASSISDADYLEPAYSADGVALVYRVMRASE